ncbi:MAG: type II secretion system F family protein [Hyphomonas sp.]
MAENSMLIYAVAGLAFLAIAGIGMALTSGQGDAAKKRAKSIGSGTTTTRQRGGRVVDENAKRRKKNDEMLDSLRKQEKERRKKLPPLTMEMRLQHAGLDITPMVFWIGSLVIGLVLGGGVYQSGFEGLTVKGIELKNRYVLAGGLAFFGAFGLPRVILSILTKKRQAKLVDQFADGLDVIVRGVKSGLPLNECLRVIAKESPDPLQTEFAILADNLAVGVGLERSLAAFYKRVPLQEMNFFCIVLMIQSKAGGNLSEALGNLSSVIRQRKMMREKVKAMSSEAKASAGIIGVLPFAVAVMVYMTTPDYIMQLFVTETGHVVLAMAAGMMTMGVAVMKKMINFDM